MIYDTLKLTQSLRANSAPGNAKTLAAAPSASPFDTVAKKSGPIELNSGLDRGGDRVQFAQDDRDHDRRCGAGP